MFDLPQFGAVVKDIGLPAAMICFFLWDMVVERRRMVNKFERVIDSMIRKFETAMERFGEARERQMDRVEERILDEMRKLGPPRPRNH